MCDKLTGDIAPFRALGRVEHIDDFYDQVDVVIAPIQMGTGLKIKSVEAVFEGLPLLITTAATIGLPATHPLHTLDDASQVAECLMWKVFDKGLLTELANASTACARTYSDDVRTSFRDLTSTIEGR